MLRLGEMTKNDDVEIIKNTTNTLFEEQEDVQTKEEKPQETSFKGIKDMYLDQNDLLDSQDFEELEETIVNGTVVARQTEKSKDLTSADHYERSIPK